MYQLYLKYKDREFIYYIPLALLSLWVRLQFFFYLLSSGKGFPQSDDTKWYLDYANSLMTHFKVGLDMNDILYIGYNILLTLLLAVFKDPVAVIFIQTVTAALSVILVYKIARLLFNRTTAIIASIFFAFSWDITLWSMYILTDSFFISLLLLCVYSLLMFFETNKNAYKILFIATAVYMIVFRPAGIITLSFIMVYIMINMNRKTVFDFLKRHRLAIGGLLTCAFVAVIYLLTGTKLDPLIASLQFNAKKVLYNIYANGWIFDKASPYDHYYRPNYNIDVWNSLIVSFLVNNFDHIVILYGQRTLALLGRWVFEIKLTNIRGIIRFAINSLPVVMFLAGVTATIINGMFKKTSILLLIIMAACVFCIIFFIDGMYRYRAPALPFVAIMAAYGADRIIKGTFLIIKKFVVKLLVGKLEKRVNEGRL